ncbi:hypothetical protein [Microbacterium maritypicum]|uniref:Holin n=1 Tax=Microbacterium maritypicum MF109 TaxID=1333857 RepID=T5KLS8_MICMQ|nr:hypothetical protein [Microbacterium liquefaciens]EQM78214.1 hypothetical protein L687_16945 [Microbacterium maritypicum MF109]
MTNIFTPKTRKYIYGVCIAAVPVLIYFKLLPAEAAPVLLPLVMALLNVGDTSNGQPEAYNTYE